ncbi:MAG: phosphoribosylformylglycinamidine synthase subunit PurL [bacterium]
MEEKPVTLELALEHGLTEEEYLCICDLLGRAPTFTELGLYSVMWSEHCSYKSSILELKTLPRRGGRLLVEAGEENAGLIDIGDGLAVCFKIESHNHPSAIEPYQGAATGVGGILRDIFTMGARPIAALNSLRFGLLSEPHQRSLLRGVVRGIGDYGNCFGVPTVAGEVYFDEGYAGNPLVNAMAVGIVAVDKIARAVAKGAGNPVFIVGSSTGRDGIHGATFASEELSEQSVERRPSVQIGDPFKEKLLLEATLELVETGALVGIQDMGAAGITCSCSETAARAGSGIEIDVARVPLRESGMIPYEICLSESQERMLVILEKGKEEIARRIFEKWDLHAEPIGVVTEGDRFVVKENGRVAADVPAASLVLGGGAPQYVRPYRKPLELEVHEQFDFAHLPEPADYAEALKRLLASPNIASKRWVFEQYDHTIGAGTAIGPGFSDAAVVRVPQAKKALALKVDGNARLAFLNPRRGAALAVCEAARNIACTGARPLGITNCLNFGNPLDEEVFYFFHEVVAGMGEACRTLDLPVTGGNVSFYNESKGKAVPPTPVIGMVGLLEDVSQAVPSGFQEEGDFIALLGILGPDLGGSEYLHVIHNLVTGAVPEVDFLQHKALLELLICLADHRLIRSAHDISEGGLAVCLAEACMANHLGAVLTFPWVGRPLEVLFAESTPCVVASVEGGNWANFRAVCAMHDVPVQMLGRVGTDSLVINHWVILSVEEMEQIYEATIPRWMEQVQTLSI